MSGFAVLVESSPSRSIQGQTWQNFLHSVASYKELDLPVEYASGPYCRGAKLDSPASLHRGIIKDDETGSWLLAVGTIMDKTNPDKATRLDNLLRDYLDQGETVLRNYDGHFALAIYDKPNNSLTIVTDPFGLFSVFWGKRDSQYFIATSALAVAQQVKATPNRLAIECFLRTGNVYGEMTLWHEVKRVKPAQAIIFHENKVTSSQYWTLIVDKAVTNLSFTASVDYALTLVSNNIAGTLKQEGKVWADLTGGFDSRLVTAMLDRCQIPFIANCVGPAGHPDVELASQISHKMGWEYKHISIPNTWRSEQCSWLESALYQGDAHLNVVSLAPVLYGHCLKAKTYTTLVQGLPGELWRGFFWRQELLSIGKTTEVNYNRLVDFRILKPFDASVLRDDCTDKIRQYIKQEFKSVASQYAEFPNTVKLDIVYAYKNTAHTGAYLTAAANSMRCLNPLFLKDIVNGVISINHRWRDPRDSRLIRVMLETVNPRLANIQTTSGGPAIPMRLKNLHKFSQYWKGASNQITSKFSKQLLGRPIIFWRMPTHPTYPLPEWRHGLLDYVKEKSLLDPAKMHSAGLYKTDQLQRFMAQAGTNGFKYNDFLGKMITIEMALRAVGTSIE